MGWFLETITQKNLDAQRDVVKNERRQSYDNRPYGRADETLTAALYPPEHPYHWPVIGWMQDLDAATLADVRAFFQRYYGPNNAALAIAGDVDAAQTLALIEKYFAEIEPVPSVAVSAPPDSRLHELRRITLGDDVHLGRLYMGWHTPAMFEPGDAAMDVAADVLGAGKAARLYRELVHEQEIAHDVEAYQNSGRLGSTLTLSVTAREGVELEQMRCRVSVASAAKRIVSTNTTSIPVMRITSRATSHVINSSRSRQSGRSCSERSPNRA
jgi:zinc protease